MTRGDIMGCHVFNGNARPRQVQARRTCEQRLTLRALFHASDHERGDWQAAKRVQLIDGHPGDGSMVINEAASSMCSKLGAGLIGDLWPRQTKLPRRCRLN